MYDDERSMLSTDNIEVSFEWLWKVCAFDGLEANHTSTRSYQSDSELEPLTQIERRAGHRCVVVVNLVILDSNREWLEVRQLKLAGCGSQKSMLLVDRLEGDKARVRSTNGCNYDWKTTAGSHVENGSSIAEVGSNMQAVVDVVVDLGSSLGGGEIDACVPLGKQLLELGQLCRIRR